MIEIMQRLRVGDDQPAVADHAGIDPVLVHVAVEDLAPHPTAGEADPIIEPIEGRQMHDHDYVVAFPLHPAMKRQHSVLIVRVHGAMSCCRPCAT